MQRRFLFATITLLIVALIFTGCVKRTVQMGAMPPDRIMYIAGRDKNIDLTGFKIDYSYRNNITDDVTPIKDDSEYIVEHEIDFNTPGVYPVVVYKSDLPKYKFAIQVVSEEYLRSIVDE